MALNQDKFPFGLAGEGWHVEKSTPSAFAGETANARGDKDGTKATMKIFTVTGDVLVRIFGVCTTTLVGAGTLEVGVTGNTAALIAQIVNATDLVANEIYNDATPTEVGAGLLSSVLGPYIVANGLDINEKVGTADITAGQVYYICIWRPISEDGNVVGIQEV